MALLEIDNLSVSFDGIQVMTDAAGERPDPNHALNRRAGPHWRWFVLVFADTPETYELYRKTVR